MDPVTMIQGYACHKSIMFSTVDRTRLVANGLGRPLLHHMYKRNLLHTQTASLQHLIVNPRTDQAMHAHFPQ